MCVSSYILFYFALIRSYVLYSCAIWNFHFHFGYFLSIINFSRLRIYYQSLKNGVVNTRGRTDKKLTSTLVIRTFLSFELPDIFQTMGVVYFSKKLKKYSYFHPHRQRRSKHDPLEPARHHYAFSPPERLYFLVL